jgi:hypothetical protein
VARRGQGLGRALCRLVPPPAHLTPESGSLTYVLVVIHTLMLQPPELIGSLLIGSLPEHTEPAVRPHPGAAISTSTAPGLQRAMDWTRRQK